jgi:chorismate synthase
MSSFGRVFRITTFGESHGKGVGVIIDGVPPNLKLTEEDIQPQLTRRRPGQSALTTPVRIHPITHSFLYNSTLNTI